MESLTKIPKIQNVLHCLVHDRPLGLGRPYILNHTKDLSGLEEAILHWSGKIYGPVIPIYKMQASQL